MHKKYTTEILDAQDGSGDGILTFPEEMIKEMQWLEGDTLNLKVENGVLLINNVTKKQRNEKSD